MVTHGHAVSGGGETPMYFRRGTVCARDQDACVRPARFPKGVHASLQPAATGYEGR